jgi:hypothetical protein
MSEGKQLTVRKSLHSKFSLDPPRSLHDLAKARENIIVLKEVKAVNHSRRSHAIPQKGHLVEFGEVSTAQLYRSMLVRPPSRSTTSA